LVTFNKNYIAVLATNFSYPLLLLLQDQNQGRPWATRMQCGRMG